MPAGYLPLFVFLVLAAAFPVGTLLLMRLIRPSSPNQVKEEAYECGVPAASTARGRFGVQFYVMAILFVIFDVETVLLFPWAVRYRQLGWFGVAEAGVFLLFLGIGYFWAYKQGALEWV